MTTKMLLSFALGSIVLLSFAGCNSSDTDISNSAPPVSSGHDESSQGAMDHDHGDHAGTDSDGEGKSDMEKMTEALADFSAEDRESAMKQHFCPVSGEMLGTMGVPEKVDVNGQSVWICCEGCKEKLLGDPETYFAKLKD
jgi:Cu(I)/Ag(I) efflux system membrane fusion protein